MSIEAFEKIKAAEEQNLAIKNSANDKYREIVSEAKKTAEKTIDEALEKRSGILKTEKEKCDAQCSARLESGSKDAAIKAAAIKVKADEKFKSAVDLVVKGVLNIGNQ